MLFDRAADTDISSVVINDADSARQATHYLIDGGARRIAFLGGSNKMKQTSDRKHGYLEALRERNIAFSTQSHFSVVFKKQFGVAPSEYK